MTARKENGIDRQHAECGNREHWHEFEPVNGCIADKQNLIQRRINLRVHEELTQRPLSTVTDDWIVLETAFSLVEKLVPGVQSPEKVAQLRRRLERISALLDDPQGQNK
jgi:hypothetical protein